MAHTLEEYAQLLKNLLPPGQAFPREPGTNLEKLLLGCAAELARVDGRAEFLAIDVMPITTTELLSDWERVAGLPDKCSGELEATIQGRRNALVAKLASVGGQSAAYFIGVAASLGYQIEIDEFRPFRAGMSRAGDALTNTPDWIFTWRVTAPATTIISFRAGLSAAGEPLRTWGNSALECKLNQLKPAHTTIIFSYRSEESNQFIESVDQVHFAINYTIPEVINGNS
jgi:uncharacterized protein YmfQ (DUF2313 family)